MAIPIHIMIVAFGSVVGNIAYSTGEKYYTMAIEKKGRNKMLTSSDGNVQDLQQDVDKEKLVEKGTTKIH